MRLIVGQAKVAYCMCLTLDFPASGCEYLDFIVVIIKHCWQTCEKYWAAGKNICKVPSVSMKPNNQQSNQRGDSSIWKLSNAMGNFFDFCLFLRNFLAARERWHFAGMTWIIATFGKSIKTHEANSKTIKCTWCESKCGTGVKDFPSAECNSFGLSHLLGN